MEKVYSESAVSVIKSAPTPKTRSVLFSMTSEAGAKGLVWTEEQLFSFLESPAAFMPKTKMAFPGLKEGQDRRDVIEYFKKFAMQ